MCATCGCMGNMKKTMKKAVAKKAPVKKAQQAAVAISKKSAMKKKGM